jgi:WD40 repeat protein
MRASRVSLLLIVLVGAGCIAIPVSTVPFHPREARPVAIESAALEHDATLSLPTFDASGAFLAVYNSDNNRVQIFRSADLTPLDDLEPRRWPRRLGFSPQGTFLVIEAHQGWVADHLLRAESDPRADIDSPKAIRDDIQRAEIWNVRSGQTVSDLSCDEVTTSRPKGGWLWAKDWAITPGYRSSALLEAHFSADESVFSMLCWDGVQQRWDSHTWQRLENIPPPAFWNALMGLTSAQWLTQNDVASRSADGRFVVLRIRESNFGLVSIYVWNQDVSEARKLPGECDSRLQPVNVVSHDGLKIVAVCNKGMGYSLRAWDLGSGRQIPLQNTDFGIGSNPTIRGEGVALSPDGRYLAVALLDLTEALVVAPIPAPLALSRSDLRLWSLEDGREVASIPIDELRVYDDYFRGVDLAFSPDSATLAVAGHRLRIYRLSDLDSRPQ